MLPSGFFQPKACSLPVDKWFSARLSKAWVKDHDVKGLHLALPFAEASKTLIGSVKFL